MNGNVFPCIVAGGAGYFDFAAALFPSPFPLTAVRIIVAGARVT